MPIIKSAKKRVRVASKAATRNSKTKRGLKSAVKSLHGAIKNGKSTDKQLRKAQSAIDTAAKKNVIHKNKAARKKSQLAKATKKAGGPAPKKTVAKKTATKKPVAKKSPAKKPVAKKK